MRHVVRAFAAVVLAVVLTSTQARAQMEVAGSAGPLATPLSNKSVEIISRILKLDEDQKALVRSLYSGYRASYKQAASDGDKKLKESFEKAREASGEADVGAKTRIEITKAFVSTGDQLEKSFFEDVKAVLNAEQLPRLDRAMKARKREVGFRFSFVAGEGVDVLQVLSDLKIDRDATPDLKEAAEQYEGEIDRAVATKEKMLRGVFDQMEKFEGPNPDPKVIEKTISEFFDTGAKVRDINRQSARKMESLLPAEKREAFSREFKKRSFPRVYAETHGEQSLAAAAGMADLTPDQKSELTSMKESYARDLDAANARFAAAIEDKQSKISGHFMEMMGGMGMEEKADDPLKLARDARKELDDKLLGRINQLLKPEQRERLPKAEEKKDGWHRPEWEPDFDERGQWDEWKKEDEN